MSERQRKNTGLALFSYPVSFQPVKSRDYFNFMIIYGSEFSSLNSIICSYNGSEFLYLYPIQPETFFFKLEQS